MCLYINKEKTESFKRNNRAKEITVYKVLSVGLTGIVTPYQATRVNFGTTLVASGNPEPQETSIPDVYTITRGAVHVFLDLKSAKIRQLKCCDYAYNRFVVKCKAKASDFVAKGSSCFVNDINEAAFKAIQIPSSVDCILTRPEGKAYNKMLENWLTVAMPR